MLEAGARNRFVGAAGMFHQKCCSNLPRGGVPIWRIKDETGNKIFSYTWWHAVSLPLRRPESWSLPRPLLAAVSSGSPDVLRGALASDARGRPSAVRKKSHFGADRQNHAGRQVTTGGGKEGKARVEGDIEAPPSGVGGDRALVPVLDVCCVLCCRRYYPCPCLSSRPTNQWRESRKRSGRTHSQFGAYSC